MALYFCLFVAIVLCCLISLVFVELRAIRKVHQARWDYERFILIDREKREMNLLTENFKADKYDLNFRIQFGQRLMQPYPIRCMSERLFQEQIEVLRKDQTPSGYKRFSQDGDGNHHRDTSQEES